jgi:hypothetical protein
VRECDSLKGAIFAIAGSGRLLPGKMLIDQKSLAEQQKSGASSKIRQYLEIQAVLQLRPHGDYRTQRATDCGKHPADIDSS